jgi:hypothetical protein
VKTRYIVVIVAFISCLVGDRAAAQETTGSISGRIADAQGLVLPGVAVAATGAQGVKTTGTDADGRFALAFLTPGTYVIHVELQGFTPINRPDVQVRLGHTVEMPLTMQIGGLEETIQVVSTTPTLDTTNTTIGESLDSATLFLATLSALKAKKNTRVMMMFLGFWRAFSSASSLLPSAMAL